MNDDSDSVSVLSAAPGALLRTVQLVHLHNLVVDEPSNHVFVVGGLSGAPGTVFMLDARSGTVLRTTTTGRHSWGLAADGRSSRVFVTNYEDNTVSVLDASSGRVLHTVAVGHVPAAVTVDTRTGHVFVANDGDSATTLDNGLGGSVSMLDARSGRVLRTILVGRDPATVVAGEPTGRVFVVHGRPGHRGYFIDNGSSGTDVLDARSGARLRTAAVGASPADDIGAAIYTHLVAVDPRTGHAFVIDRPAVDRKGTSTRGSVSVLDARSGRVLRRIPVGTAPMALAVDETTTRLFVVNEDPERMPGKRPNLWGWIPRAVRRGVPWLSQPSPQTYNGSVTVIDPSRV